MAAQLGGRTTPVHTLFDEDDEPVPTVGEQNKQPDPAGAGGNSVEEVVVNDRRKDRKSMDRHFQGWSC